MQPLAERMRPQTLDDYVGQDHLVGEKAVLRRAVEAGRIPSFILWGPPGVGKTTLASIIAKTLKRPFHTLSAISAGVKDIRETIDSAKKQKFFDTPSPILFIDEIHRFSKCLTLSRKRSTALGPAVHHCQRRAQTMTRPVCNG